MAPVMPLKDSRARAVRALELRARRWTWAEIATELQFRTRGGAQLAVSRLLRSQMPDTTTKRAVATSKLEDQEKRLYPRFEAAVDSGDDETAVMISKHLAQLVDIGAKIDGIAVQRAQIDVDVNLSVGEIIAQTRQRLLSVIDAEVVDIREIER
jgi:hypothetical protein